MKNEIVSLQNNPLLLAKAVEDTPPLTLVQNRILLYIFWKVLERSKENGWEISKMKDEEINLSMLLYDIPWDLEWVIKKGKGGNQTAEIWNQLETLHQTAIVLKGNQKRTHLIQSIQPPKVADGKYRIQLDPDILRNVHYREGEIYRLIKMKYALALGSVNHFNLYKTLKAVEGMKEWKIELDELKAMLHLQKQYPKYAHFRNRVLKSSQKALNETTDISFTFSEVRGARKKVTHLVFKVRVKQNKTIEIPKSNPYTPKLESDLKSRRVQHLRKWADEGITEEHWRKALNTDLMEGALVMEAKKYLNQVNSEHEKVKDKESQEQRMKRNRDWFIRNHQNKLDEGWREDGITLFPKKGGGINYSNYHSIEDFKTAVIARIL